MASMSRMSHLKREHLVAGSAGGFVSTVALHPVDLLKIRFAASDGKSASPHPHYKGVVSAFRTIIQNEGFSALYRGVVPSVWGASVAWGGYFFMYSAIKETLQDGDPTLKLHPIKNSFVAGLTGAFTLTLTNPLFMMKTRLCLQYNKKLKPGDAEYKGMIDGLVKTFKNEGIPGLYRGYLPGLIGVAHGAVHFVLYEEMKSRFNMLHGKAINEKLHAWEYLLFAASSKIVAAVVTYPHQVIRVRLQDKHALAHSSNPSFFFVIKDIWRSVGLKGFYRGVTPHLLHTLPNVSIVFATYEVIVTKMRQQQNLCV